MPNAILTLFPTADATDVELERAVLQQVIEYCADPLHRMITRDAVINDLFPFDRSENG